MRSFNPREPWKTVHVRAYTRFRLGKLEYVIDHFRSYPGMGMSGSGQLKAI